MKIKIKSRQTIYDIALQFCGDREAAFEISKLNNTSVTEYIEAGTELDIPDIYKKRIVEYYQKSNIEPATEIDTPDTLIRTNSGEIIRRESGEPYTILIN